VAIKICRVKDAVAIQNAFIDSEDWYALYSASKGTPTLHSSHKSFELITSVKKYFYLAPMRLSKILSFIYPLFVLEAIHFALKTPQSFDEKWLDNLRLTTAE
jgi:hypothetical protein